jgi:hypothetical protein
MLKEFRLLCFGARYVAAAGKWSGYSLATPLTVAALEGDNQLTSYHPPLTLPQSKVQESLHAFLLVSRSESPCRRTYSACMIKLQVAACYPSNPTLCVYRCAMLIHGP